MVSLDALSNNRRKHDSKPGIIVRATRNPHGGKEDPLFYRPARPGTSWRRAKRIAPLPSPRAALLYTVFLGGESSRVDGWLKRCLLSPCPKFGPAFSTLFFPIPAGYAITRSPASPGIRYAGNASRAPLPLRRIISAPRAGPPFTHPTPSMSGGSADYAAEE